MPREKELFRDNLLMLQELYPGRVTITLNEACELLGKHRQTLMNSKTFPKVQLAKRGEYLIPIARLASYLS